MSGSGLRAAALGIALAACGRNATLDADPGAATDAGMSEADAAVWDGAQERPVYRTHEGQFCSSAVDEDPFYECSRASHLVCITTYTKNIVQPDGAPDKTTKIWLCRESCTPGAGACVNPGEICCPGPIFGESYGNSHGCVPRDFCDHPPADGGARE
jgi:hypothetical protein